ncbi:MAG: hypothetical protein ACQES9_00705 [Myxococcota bacterium]
MFRRFSFQFRPPLFKDGSSLTENAGSLFYGNLQSPFSIQNDTCSNQRFSPSDECTFIIRYSPTAPGTDNDSLDIPSDDPDKNPLTITVSGTGKSIYDALSGDGNVNRTILTYDTMMDSATPSDTVDDGAFGIPAGAANPDHVFEGSLSLKMNQTPVDLQRSTIPIISVFTVNIDIFRILILNLFSMVPI